MNRDSDHLRHEQILRSLLVGKALIIRNALRPDWPAHPQGHLRKRPLFWVDRADVEPLLEAGKLVQTDRGIDLSAQTRDRLMGGKAGRAQLD
ncbi:MAG: hypothetical protein WBF53_08030, partial [Litorimonas sp.]